MVSPAVVAQVQPAGWLPPVMMKPAGNTSVQLGLVAALGPRLLTLTVKVMGSPAVAGAGFALLLIAMSAPGVTTVVTSSVLLAGFGSGSEPALTTAELMMLPPPTFTLARNVKERLAPATRLPAWVAVIVAGVKLQPGPSKLPATRLTPAGNVSCTLNPADVPGPSLVTVSV